LGSGEPEVIVLSSFLRRAVYPAMSSAGLFARRVHAGDVCVLTYHGVLPEGSGAGQSPVEGTLVSAAQFRRQLRFLKSRYQLITPETFRAWLNGGDPAPERAVLLTCDDGLLNALTDMVPILLEEGARCLFFVTGASLQDGPACLWYEELYSMLDQAPGHAMVNVDGKIVRKDSLAKKDLVRSWWTLVQELSKLNSDERRAACDKVRAEWRLTYDWRMYDPTDERAERRHRLLNQQELKKLVAHGMTVGAHTMTHPLLTSMPGELVEREIRESRSRLEAFLGQEIWSLAYPFGHEGSAGVSEMKIAEASGYTCAFVNYGGGLLRRTSSRFALPRAHVTAEMDLPELEAHLTGFHEGLQRRLHRGGGVVREEVRRCA
jgi:peptidoglycan/xylan/chitin deacetylase (PgdA/CDA1 family)